MLCLIIGCLYKFKQINLNKLPVTFLGLELVQTKSGGTSNGTSSPSPLELDPKISIPVPKMNQSNFSSETETQTPQTETINDLDILRVDIQPHYLGGGNINLAEQRSIPVPNRLNKGLDMKIFLNTEAIPHERTILKNLKR